MATKPPAPGTLDTGSSLYSHLTNVWAMLEGSGTTVADSKAGNTATLVGSLGWSSDAEGPFTHATAGGMYMTLASGVTIPINTSFTLAFGTKNVAAVGGGNQSMITGNTASGSAYWWMHGGNSGMTVATPLVSGTFTVAAANSETNRTDFVLSFAYSGGNYTLNCYNNGTLQTGSPVTVTAGAATTILNAIGHGYNGGNGYSFTGDIYYFYYMQGYAATQTDATNLNTNPYFIFSAGPPSFVCDHGTIPANHPGNIAFALTGTNTTFTSGSTVTKTVLSGSPTITLGTWVRTDNTHAVQNLTTGGGTGTFKITVDGTDSPTFTVANATISVFGLYGGTSLTEGVTFTGTNTLWSADAPAITISGAGNSVGTPTYTSNTAGTATITCGAVNGAYTITDPSTGATCTFNVATPYSYNLIPSPPAWMQLEGEPFLAGSPQYWGGIQDGCCRFRAKCGQIDIKNAAGGGYLRLAIDGVLQNTGSNLSIPSVGGAPRMWMPVATGLDTTTEHEYQVWFGGASAAVSMYLSDVLLIGGTGPNTAALPARPIVQVIGDSVSIGAQINPTHDSTLSWIVGLGAISRYQVLNMATGSRAISSGGGAGTGVVGNLSYYTGLAQAPAAIYFLDGVVDVLDLYNVAQFGTDYATCIASFRSNYPNAWIICCEIQSGNPPDDSVVAPYNAQIVAKTNAAIAGGDTKLKYSTVIHDLVATEGLTGYHPHQAESVDWRGAVKTELDALLINTWIYGDQCQEAMG